MSAAKIKTYNTPDAMKSDGKLVKPENEGQDTLDSIIRQAIGKDPFLSFSRANDNPVQWIQFLHALDQQGSSKVSRSSKADSSAEGMGQSLELCNGTSSFLSEINGVKESEHSLKANCNPAKGAKSTSEHMQSLKIPEAVAAFAQAAAKANGEPEKYLPGWPLLSPPKVQLQKCDKCSLEFCSAINYRRHTRVHRRSLNIVKDSSKTREFLGAFWDKLSTDEAKELVSFENASVEEVTGSSVIRALSSWVRKPGYSSLPQTYVRAGVTLLDVVQARPSRFPITSQELFNALDDASEKTFLCSGTALSVQKYVFDGEVGKNALELKNLVACTSFLLEQILVKAWLADKDAEALRCQKLLVEEEEAAQKRQAELLEKKRLKKLRQKEQKSKEVSDGEKVDSNLSLLDTPEGSSGSAGTPSPRGPSESELSTSEASLHQDPLSLSSMQPRDSVSDANLRQPLYIEDADQGTGHQMRMGSERWKPIASQRLVPKQARKALNGFHAGQVTSTKSSGFVRHGNYRDPKSVPLANGHKVWTPKSRPECETEGTSERETVSREQAEELVVSDKTKVMIGSITVALGDGDVHPQNVNLRMDNVQEKPFKSDSNRAAVKLWRPVSRHGNGDSAMPQSDKADTKMNGIPAVAVDQVSSGIDDVAPGEKENGGVDSWKNSATMDPSRDFSEPRLFSREVAEAFLAQRWKEAMAADHVKLVLSPETDPSDSSETVECNQPGPRPQSAGRSGRSILGSAENRITGVGLMEPASACASKPKFKPKTEKTYKLKYVPKQRNNTVDE